MKKHAHILYPLLLATLGALAIYALYLCTPVQKVQQEQEPEPKTRINLEHYKRNV